MSFLLSKELVDELQRFGFVGDPTDMFVALEPCHLSFCVAHAFGRKFFNHRFLGDIAAEVSADPAIFKTKIVETIPTDAFRVQARDLREHAGFDAFMEARFDKLAQCLGRSRDADRKGFIGCCRCERCNGRAGDKDYLERADQSASIVAIDNNRAIRVELFELREK